MICNVFPETLLRLLLALCPNISSSGIQFATAQLPLLELMDCGMSVCDSNDESLISDEAINHGMEKRPNSNLHLIHQKLIIKHTKLKKLSLWGCSGLDVNNDSFPVENHLPFKRLVDGSKRVRVPHFLCQQQFDVDKKQRTRPPCNVLAE
ncbi:F-box/LRR-repeat protein 17-like isoform X2 [Syzygium oleosum]|uniref:F-box/LRR-repeat protein 17-like isoform X2 n=1 Tax=Syzygium oleosum TaxID=219896 RepID=UPI0024B9B99B|nr:F-box/LRR-repeat protein 17-like isoform X2 [Syzygium oleosum]